MKHYIKSVIWRFRDVSSEYPDLARLPIRSPQDVVAGFKNLFKDQVRERFVVLWLNSANRVIGFQVISEGILDSSLVHPREAFRGAMVATCSCIILGYLIPPRLVCALPMLDSNQEHRTR